MMKEIAFSSSDVLIDRSFSFKSKLSSNEMERGGSSCAENALRATSSYWHDETLDPGCAIREKINEMVKILNDIGRRT